ncbi:MAG: 50S ribosomal protein L4 [Candidatus Muiribacteriaceae bacterium]
MAEIKVLNMEGKETDKMQVADSVFAVKVNKHLVHETVLNQLANRRRGTASTKTRSEVTGSGRKPFRQKGTGRARQGTLKSPVMPGGGVAFGPRPRDYSYSMNRKARKIAIKSALSDKLGSEKAWAVDMKVDGIKTKIFEKFFRGADVYGRKNLVVMCNEDEKDNILRSARNIKYTKVINVDSINVYDMVKYENVFFSKNAVTRLEEVYNAK